MTVISRIYQEQLGGDYDIADFIGVKGEIFYDRDNGSLRLSDGVTAGGIPLTGGGSSGSFDPVQYYTRAAVDGKFTALVGSATVAADTLGELEALIQQYLPKTGGVVTGPIKVSIPPSVADDLTNKAYVDAAIAAGSASLTTTTVTEGTNLYYTETRVKDAVANTSNTPGIVRKVNGVVPDANGAVSIALTNTITGAFGTRPATTDNGTLFVVSGDANTELNGDAYIWTGNSTVGTWEVVAPADTATNDARYVNVSGDTMAGPLVLAGAPTANLHAATKLYVDSITLDSLSDVTSSTATAGQSLVFNGTSWVPATPAAKLGDLTDVSNTAPGTGYVLGWDSANSEWKPIASAATPTLAGLLDVDVTGVANNSLLQYSEQVSKWTVATPQPKKTTMLQEHGNGWGRAHVYGNEVFCAGFGGDERIHAWNHGGRVGFSISAPFEVRPPGIAKLVDGISYQHVVGTDGYLYSRGRDSEGQMGTGNSPGRPVDDRGGIFRRNEDPKIYGPGITVTNVWSHRTTFWDTYAAGSLWVEVNDNGTKKLYAAGYNGYNALGVGGSVNQNALMQSTTADPNLAQLNGKGIKKLDCHSHTMMLVTENGELWGAGYNLNGAIGVDFIGATSLARSKYADGSFVTNAIDVQTSWVYTIGTQSWFLRNDGTVWGSGSNSESNLCNGATGNVTKFKQVLTAASTPITGVVKIKEVGRGQLFMLKSDGTVWATGRNNDGVFGNVLFPVDTSIGLFAKQIQTGIQDFWSVGGNQAGWCTVFWKKSDKLFFSGNNGQYIGGGFTEALAGGDYNFLQPVFMPDGAIVKDVKMINQVNETGANYRGASIITEDDEIYLTGISAYVGIQNDGDDIYLKSPYKLTDYLGGATETVYITKTQPSAIDDLSDVVAPTATTGQLLTYDGTKWIAKTLVPDTQTIVTKVTGEWTLNPGLNNVSFTVPFNQVVTAYVIGNIPNGIVTYNGTFIVTNGNVNAVGNQYAWSYILTGNAHTLELTAIPDQIVGTSGTILSTVGSFGSPARLDANVLKFTINNKTSTTQLVKYGYVPLS